MSTRESIAKHIMSWRAGWLLAAGAVSCHEDSIALPTPPEEEETEATVEAYEMPTGSIDASKLQATAEQVSKRIEERHLDALANLVSEALAGLRDRMDRSAMPIDPGAAADPDRAVIQAVIRLTRTCNGFAEAPSEPDAALNGTVDVTAVVANSELVRHIWGTATACRSSVSRDESSRIDVSVNASLDGELIIYLYGALPETPVDAEFLVRFSGDIGGTDRTQALEFDFRVTDGLIEFRHAVDDGDIIVGVSPTRFTLRGSNATFTCDFVKQSCE